MTRAETMQLASVGTFDDYASIKADRMKLVEFLRRQLLVPPRSNDQAALWYKTFVKQLVETLKEMQESSQVVAHKGR